MFKRIMVLLLVISIILVLPVMAGAEESSMTKSDAIASEDSKIINTDITSKLNDILSRNNVDPEGAFFRVYSVSITLAFTEYDNIDDVLASRELLEVYYAIKDSKGEYIFYTESGIRMDVVYFNYQTMETCKSGDIPSIIADDVVVYNTYYLSGESCHAGSAIYYKTNKGDFVYYDHQSGGEYLFPIEAFCAYQKAVRDVMVAMGDADGGVDLKTIWDLSPYDFKSPSFDLNADIPDNRNIDKENKENSAGIVETAHPLGIETAANERGSDYTWIIVLGACSLLVGIAGGIIWWRKKQMH